MRGKPAIIEIAKALNLSRNTVSKVINNKEGVSPKTKNLILEYIASGDVPAGLPLYRPRFLSLRNMWSSLIITKMQNTLTMCLPTQRRH